MPKSTNSPPSRRSDNHNSNDLIAFQHSILKVKFVALEVAGTIGFLWMVFHLLRHEIGL